MHIRVPGLALIPVSIFSLPRKLVSAGNTIAGLRLSLLKVCEKQIKSELRIKAVGDADAVAALSSIGKLIRVNDHGWVSAEECMAVQQVITLALASESHSVREEVKDHLHEMQVITVQWLADSYKDVTSVSYRSVDPLNRRVIG